MQGFTGRMGAAFLLLVLSSPAGAEVLGVGRFLVARRELHDANFIQTVVLLLQHGESGSWGVVINRPSKAPLSLVLKELAEAKERSDPAFLGGPMARTGAIALLRSSSKPEESEAVFGDVYRLLTRKGLQKALKEGTGAARLRVYLGYAGWGRGQLENEVKWGMWHTLRADPTLLFDSDPDKVWPRLIRQFEVNYAGNPAFAPCVRLPPHISAFCGVERPPMNSMAACPKREARRLPMAAPAPVIREEQIHDGNHATAFSLQPGGIPEPGGGTARSVEIRRSRRHPGCQDEASPLSG